MSLNLRPRISSACRNKSAAAGNSPARSFPIPTTCAPCPANRSAIFFISFLLLIALWTRCERSFLQGHFTLARDDSLASINKRMAFTVREIESPDPVTRVVAEEAKLREADHDIGEKMILNMDPSHPATHGVMGLGAMAIDLGAMTVFLYSFTQREKIYVLSELLSGARFTTSYTRVGGQIRDLPEKFIPMLRDFLDQFGPALDEMDKLLTRNRIFVDRTKDVGVISKERAIAYALSGPNLRGSGVEHDLRRKHPYLGYEQYDFEVVIGSAGDCYDRYLVRVEEMRQSAKILRQVIDRLPSGPINAADWKNMTPPKSHVMTKMEELIHHFIVVTEGLDAPPGEIYFAAENPKGELGFYIKSKGGGVPHRLKIRAPSFVNLSILPEVLPGHMVSDVPAVLGSLDFVMGECDR